MSMAAGPPSTAAAAKARADQLMAAGRAAEAREGYATACRLDPNDAEGRVKLSLAERALGRLDAAEREARMAIKLRPKSFLGPYALGLALHSRGDRETALANYRQASALEPRFPDLHYLAGVASQELGRVNEAEAAYRQAIAQRPGYIAAMSGLAAVLMARGETGDAETLLRQILAAAPEAVEAIANLAALRLAAGAVDEGMELYGRALERASGRPDIHAQAAELMERMGQVDQARDAIAAAPGAENHPVGALVLGRIALREDRFEDGLAALEPALRSPSLVQSAEAEVLAGQLLDRLGRYDEAFQRVADGKRRAAQATGLDVAAPPAYLREIALARGLLGPGLAAVRPAEGSDAPAFLVGFPRSGTTLLEQVLDGHPAIQTLDEAPAVTAMANAFMALADGGADLGSLSGAQVEELRGIYFAAAERRATLRPGALLVDKLPLNLIWAPLIWRVFPEARFILALRHPMDCCLSCFMQPFSMNSAMASFVTVEGAAQVYAAAMQAWRDAAAALPLAVHTVRYEAVVNDLAGEAAGVLEFLGLEWDAGVLTPDATARAKPIVSTPSYQQVARPIYRQSVDRWRRYEARLAGVAPILEPFVAWAGYA